MAGPVNPGSVSFTAPTRYVNGQTIPSNGIARFEYGFGRDIGNYTTIVSDTDFTAVGGKQVGAIPANLGEGQWYVAARAVSTGGGVGAWGNAAPFVVTLIPEAISDLSLSG